MTLPAPNPPVTKKALLWGMGLAVLIGILAAAVFLTRPDIDLWVSGLFGSAETRFPLRFHPVPRFFNSLVNWLAGLSAFVLILGLGLTLRYGGPLFSLWARHYGYLLAALAVGPGLIANLLFKEHWGRARPRTVEAFGGKATFSPPLVPSDQCASNCSFVSGDASLAFFFLAVALVLPSRFRAAGVMLALAFGALISAMRIIQGAHFLSDVIFAGVFVALTTFGLYWVMLKDWKAPSLHPMSLGERAGLTHKRAAQQSARAENAGLLWRVFRARPGDLDVPPTD